MGTTKLGDKKKHNDTFHFSSSSCFEVYCLRRSSSTFFRPSALVVSCGMTSFTVLSTSTPLIIRKHFLSPGSGSSVSMTSLECSISIDRTDQASELYRNLSSRALGRALLVGIEFISFNKCPSDPSCDDGTNILKRNDLLVLFSLLLYITNFLCDCLESLLVIRILSLQLYLN